MRLLPLSIVALALLAAGCNPDDIDPGDNTNDPDPIVLTDPELAWSASTCEATIGKDNTFPTLSNPHNVDVTFTSSDSGIATVSAAGAVSLVAAGNVSITASSTANSTYSAGSVSYRLTVRTENGGEVQGNDGAGSYVFDSSGDPSSDDDISKTTFTRMITVTFADGGATVTGDDNGLATVSGNRVTVNNTGSEVIVYRLTGSTSNGCFRLYSERKQALLLDGLTLTNPDGAAIDNQSGKRTFVMVEGTNTLSDGASAAYTTADEEDMKAVFFSEGQLIFSGSGSLTVNALNKQEKSGIVSDDYVRVMRSPSIEVQAGTSAGHGIRGKDYVQLSGGLLTVSAAAAGKKGIGSDDYVLVEGGTHSVSVSGGLVYDNDDQEYKGSAGVRADNYFGMTGGSLTILNTGEGGKGLSAGSYNFDEKDHKLDDSYISGGTLTVTVSGKDTNVESAKAVKIGYKVSSGSGWNAKATCAGNMTVSGGTVIVNCTNNEGFEVKGDLTFTGGEVYVTSSADDAINCAGELTVNGGYIYSFSSRNDAMDSNGNMKLNGGYVFAICTKGTPEVGLDANTEGGYKLYINKGATVVAYGGLENGYSAEQNVYSISCAAGNWNALYGDKSFIAAFKVPSGISTVAVSAPSLSKGYKAVTVGGTTYCNGIWATAGISGGSEVSLEKYSGNQGGPGGPGGGGPGGGGGWPGGWW